MARGLKHADRYPEELVERMKHLGVFGLAVPAPYRRAWRSSRAGGHPPGFDQAPYRQRNAAEYCVSKWKQYRSVATRYDKRDYVFNGTRTVTAIVIWLRDTVQEPPEMP